MSHDNPGRKNTWKVMPPPVDDWDCYITSDKLLNSMATQTIAGKIWRKLSYRAAMRIRIKATLLIYLMRWIQRDKQMMEFIKIDVKEAR